MPDTPNQPPAQTLIDAQTRVFQDVDQMVIHRSQVITDYHKDFLRHQQDTHEWRPDGMTKLCEIPQATADRWLVEGFDIYKAPAREIIARLRKEEMDLFVTIGKKSY